MLKKLSILLVVLIFIGVGIAVQVVSNINKEMEQTHVLDETLSLELVKGSTLNTLGTWFFDNGFIKETRDFKVWRKINDVKPVIKAGHYEFSGEQSVVSILAALERGDVVQYRFSIIEGSTVKDMLAALKNVTTLEEVVLTEQEIIAALSISAARLEGLLYPDTYQYNKGDTALSLLKRAYERMETELTAIWQKRDSDSQLKTPYEAIIMASIIEKETAAVEERPMISGVFNNRLKKGMLLQTDPTVIYGIGETYDGNITKTHLRTDTPYNTYTRKGLPPTPIAFAGKEAIEAAVHPQPTKALYFVATGQNGTHYFSKTLAEHNSAVRKYILNK